MLPLGVRVMLIILGILVMGMSFKEVTILKTVLGGLKALAQVGAVIVGIKMGKVVLVNLSGVYGLAMAVAGGIILGILVITGANKVGTGYVLILGLVTDGLVLPIIKFNTLMVLVAILQPVMPYQQHGIAGVLGAQQHILHQLVERLKVERYIHTQWNSI